MMEDSFDSRDEEQEQWVWRNGMCCSVKKRIHKLDKKLDGLNRTIEKVEHSQQFLKDVIDLNTELIGYFRALSDNINIRDLFDFLTICFFEYEHFFREHHASIVNDEYIMSELMPMARDIVYNHLRSILDFIINNTIDPVHFRAHHQLS